MRLEFAIELIAAELLYIIPSARRKYFIPKAVLCGVVIVVTALFLDFDVRIVSFVRYMAIFILTCVAMILCWKMEFSRCAFIGICSYSMQHIGYQVSTLFSGLFPRTLFDSFLQRQIFNIIFSTAMYALVYAVMYFIFIARFKKERDYFVVRPGQIILASVILITTMILNLIRIEYGYGIHPALQISIQLYAIVCCLFSIVVQYEYFRSDKLARDKEIFDRLLESESKYRLNMKENMDFIHFKYHDLKKQLAGLRKICNEDAREKNLAEIERAMSFIDSDIHTGNESLDLILMEKKVAFEKGHVSFSYIADGESLGFMSAVDIYSLFFNALDNAYESVMKIPDEEKRVVCLKAYRHERLYFIELENSYVGTVSFDNGLPVSQGDVRWHGFGVKSISYIAKKYGGNAVFDADGETFTLKILLPVP